jgi:hypothetical protein
MTLCREAAAMSGIDKLKVVPFTPDRVPNPYPGGRLLWQAYHTVRNALVRACREHGPTGPLGEVVITPEVADPYRKALDDPEFWERGDPDPHYYLIEDQLNHERYCYAELYGSDPFTAEWLATVTRTLREHDRWGLGIGNIPDGYVLVFGQKLMVKGRRLARCTTAMEVVEAVRRSLNRGEKKWWQFWS